MKIGIDARLWNETGVGRYIRNLVRELSEIDSQNDYVLFVSNQDKELIRKQILNKNWKLVPVSIKWHSLSEQFMFASVIQRENLDLMHFPYFSLPILYRKPFVVTIHDLIIHHFSTGKASTLPLPLYQLKRLGYKQVLKHAITHSKKIIVPLSSVKQDVIDVFHIPESKIIVTKEGFDNSLAKDRMVHHRKLPFDHYFLYVGNAYPHKNVALLLQAFRIFSKSHPNSGLVLIGKEDYFYKSMKHNMSIQASQNIVHLSDVSDGELSHFYANSLALVSPSHMEGFGLTALEAMGIGCIPLVSDIPAFHEVCEDGAIYFDQNSVESLTEQMETVIRMGSDEKKKLLRLGEKRVALFSWKEMAKQTIRAYEESVAIGV